MCEKARLEVDAFDVYAGSRINVNAGAELVLGSGYMNHDCVIDCFSSIRIGQNVVISERVVIRDSDNHFITWRGGNCNEDKPMSAPIVIGDHVWIGMNVILLNGVVVRRGTTIAAGAVVTKSTPPYSVMGGVPAKHIKFYWNIDQIIEHEKSLYP